MSHVTDLRSLAREHAARLRTLTNGDASAAAILAAAERDTGVGRVALPAGDSLLDGGDAVYDPEPRQIWYNRDVDPGLAALYQAHEYAHLWLDHSGRSQCDRRDLDPESPDEPVPLGVHRVEGYGPKERRERDANVFARELLLPADLLRQWFIGEGLDAIKIAERVGVPLGVVYHQLAYAVLVGDLPRSGGRPSAPSEAGGTDRPAAENASVSAEEFLASLDPSQRAAASVEHGPVLVEAGPGTGKTRTLVGRVLHLLDRGVDPRRILALTYSNKAAGEMRERVARVTPEAAPLIWMGTFHAFGLDLLRKYGSRIGLPTDPPVLDPVDAMFLLEQDLPALSLDHYQHLPEPTKYLKPILAAISRAKDELKTPDDYQRAAAEMRAAATSDDDVHAAEKAAEVAHVYRVYQATLEERGALDFGDLITRSVALLADERHGVGAAVREAYPHVLVDEYQDVNRASAILLATVAGDGRGLWVVGDARQSIYRFRGAAPSNMARFTEDFAGGRVLRLSTNYRSQPPVVAAVSRFAEGMPAIPGVEFTPWIAHRPNAGGAVQMEIATNAGAEGRGIAGEVRRHRERGVQYREQAVLCRSHTNLARVGAALEAAGIPVLYLGDLFERAEVRDMLALLSLACRGDGRGLVRVARFPEYAIPLADVRATLRFAREQDLPFPEALAQVAALPPDATPLSEGGQLGMARLAEHLHDLCYGSEAWTMLSRYLLERSDYARRHAGDATLAGRQRRLALYQFLQFAYEQRRRGRGLMAELANGGKGDPKRGFLRFVRRLAMVGDDAQLRQVPEWAATIDAVRLMTVHASKGLEFPVVYLPALGTSIFPLSRKPNHCPVPPQLLGEGRDAEVEREHEEECLFFVAISRAQDVLCLSRALTYDKRGSRRSPSVFLARLDPVLPRPSGGSTPTWMEDGQEDAGDEATFEAPIPESFSARSLETYLTCPRRYFYENVLELRAMRDDSAYLEMHGCVHQTARWIAERAGQGEAVNIPDALQRLAEAWDQRGPRDHPYEPLYRAAAEALVATAVEEISRRRGRGTQSRPEWSVSLPNGTVTVVPDEVDLTDEQGRRAIVVRRIRTGRPSKSELDKNPLYGLLHAAAAQEHGALARVEVSYLATGTTEIVSLTDKMVKSRVDKYDEAMAAIKRGEFPAKPDEHQCPRCAQYFICPMAEDGGC